MTTSIRLTVAWLAVSLSTAGHLYAGPVFSQPLATPFTSRIGVSSNGPLSNTPFETQQVAETFSLTSDASITSVDWFGHYRNNAIPPAQSFLIRFFSESSSLPDTLLLEEEISVLGVETGLFSLANRPILEYSATLSSPFAATESTTYFISILENDPSTTSVWAWQNTAQDTTNTEAFRIGEAAAWQTVSFADVAFTLNSDTAAVPEPSSFALLALGAAGVTAWRLRRKKSRVESEESSEKTTT